MKTNDPRVSTPEFIAMLGMVPDWVMADLVKALNFNGRTVGTLDPDEKKVFDFFRENGRKYGVTVGETSIQLN
ncbi:hypothetical protein [Pseudomonas sp. MWU12-2323]|uniref:hypothetical protein n=1 Tax=Pseudomonas sp. MWU12-2323 TaxID=2651296 RepID=UPI00128E67F5|nr:hypothetical protein [Pseudomonas sp. MWU12-2323]MPQ69460.1 hypothetical protein [Pseudomonas sp. MWU12-2323]